MEEQFCTYEISSKLKELGFDEECLGCFREDKSFLFCDVFAFRDSYTESEFKENVCCDLYYKNSIILNELVAAPLCQQVIDWFRKTYNLNIFFFEGENSKYRNVFSFCILNTHYTLIDFDFENGDDFDIIREQAILKAIELIKTN